MTKIPSDSKIESRLAIIPSDANRSLAKTYLLEKEADDVKPQSRLAITDPLVALGRHLGDRPWIDARREEIIAVISGHRYCRGAHLAKTPGEARPLASSTRHQWWSYIKGFYRYLNDEETPKIFRRSAFPKKDALSKRGRWSCSKAASA